MSDTTQAAVGRLRENSPTVDAVCRQLERQVDPDEVSLVVDFTQIFFSKAPPDFLHERSTDALAHMALGAYRFLERSAPDRVDVEVLNPDVDNEGWYAPVTVIRTDISERPFIVDTIREFLNSQDVAIEHYIYPVIHVDRDEKGRIREVRPSREGSARESLVHCEVARVPGAAALDFIKAEIAARLQDVVRSTDDFHPMVDALNEVVAELAERVRDTPERSDELKEVQAFLRWLRDGSFVFLGYRGYDIFSAPGDGEKVICVEPGSGLGILRNEGESAYAEPVPLERLDPGLRKLVEGGPLLIISKTNAESTVHRRARMDYIGVKKLDGDGNVVGEHRFMGLFTSRAYAEEAENIPILREKLHRILEDAGVQEGSHDYKEINTIFNSMPKEELFLTSAEQIGADVRTVLTTYHSDEVRVTVREDPLQRGVSVMVILPKERFSGEVRKSIEGALVEAFRGEVLNYHLALGEGDQARLHFYMAAPPRDMDRVQPVDLERAIRELIRSWEDRVREGLERIRPPDEARRLARRYGEGFSAEYRAATSPAVAVADILEVETMQSEGRSVSIALSNREGSPAAPGLDDEVTELKLYLRGERLILSDFMPILENAGLRVIAVNPFQLEGRDEETVILYSFAVQDQERRPLEVKPGTNLLSEAVLAVRDGKVTNDVLNSLVLSAGLQWREVDVLRSYASYAFQVGAVPSRVSLPTALIKHPDIARHLFDLFRSRFETGRGDIDERKEAARAIRTEITSALSGVTLLSDDRALRRLWTLIDATLRTNFYRNGGKLPTRLSGGVPYISFKFDARELQAISRNRLMYEVWVRSSRMEGIHLRGSRVARGGIRWSDRPDDFRTEVFGLVKTQMVKNAVIVPAGSKGGFVTLRQLPAEEMGEEGKEQYRTLIRGLLDITDNLDDDGELLPPEDVVRWDDDDPYLVVAADKGTAKFSDVANAVADEYDFWLGDAFASGGSQGYDHKTVGITARGAWECVKRHFLEMGKDIQAEPFTVVGIGDMSGDVFGNGMLLSRQIRLVAAFDHRHIFIDPDPDPATSYEERQRLFDMGRSSWEDYDREVMSEGGMIIPRGAKRVELTAEARRALGIEEEGDEPLDGESLIRWVLQAPAELLWNGGIGTYVKSATETQADAGDPSNDAVRVDSHELRCAVVGEGGNLGLTQRARVEYALGGGRINTDALDNSGGVDLSDREVNLKILLNPGVRSGHMEEEDRNELLETLTDSVAELVLEDNRSQSLAISLDNIRVGDSVDDFRELMTALEKSGHLDRSAEHLPTLESLVERQEEGNSLTRPELCVLLAYTKLFLMGHLLNSGLPDDGAAESYLLGYFPPKAVMEAGHESLQGHRLRREIISSQLTNDLVDLMGSTFVHRVMRDTGRLPDAVGRAWLVASRLAGHRSLLKRMSVQGRPLDASVAYRWLLGLSRVLERTTRWVLQNVPGDVPTADVIDENIEGLSVLRRDFGTIVEGADRKIFRRRVREIQELGADEEFAESLITLRFLDQLLEILRVARETGSDVVETGRAFYQVSDRLSVPWIRGAVFDAAADDRWEQRAAQALAGDLTRAHHRLVVKVMRGREGHDSVVDATDALLDSMEREVGRYCGLLDELRTDAVASLSGVSVAVREITVLSERLGGSAP